MIGKLTTHFDSLPIIFYGADSFDDQVTYCEELDGRIQSQVTAIDYSLDEAHQPIEVRGGLKYERAYEDSFLHTMEVFLLNWTAYLYTFAQYVPDFDTFAKYGVHFSKPAVYPIGNPVFMGLFDMEGFEAYLEEVFKIQGTHEAAVSMLRQRIMASDDLVPAKWLAIPGHSEPRWKIEEYQEDTRPTNDSAPRIFIPINSARYPIPAHYPALYSFVRHSHIQFCISHWPLFNRLNTMHTRNREKMELYEATGVPHEMNPLSDDYFEGLQTYPTPASTPNSFQTAPEERNATLEDISLWDSQEPTQEERDSWSTESLYDARLEGWGPQPERMEEGLVSDFDRAFATWCTGYGHADSSWTAPAPIDAAPMEEAPAIPDEVPLTPHQSTIPLSPDTTDLPSLTDSIDEDFFEPPFITAALMRSPDFDNALHLSTQPEDPGVIFTQLSLSDSLTPLEDAFVEVNMIRCDGRLFAWDDSDNLITID